MKSRLVPSEENLAAEKLEEIEELTKQIEKWLEDEERLTNEVDSDFSKGLNFGMGLTLELVSGKIRWILEKEIKEIY